MKELPHEENLDRATELPEPLSKKQGLKLDDQKEKLFNTNMLHLAIPTYEESDDEIDAILMQGQFNIDFCDSCGNNFLILSCEHGKTELVRVFSKLLHVDAQNEFGSTALHTACYTKNLEITQILLSAGANPNIVDSYLCSPLHYAASAGSTALVAALIGKKAKANIQDFIGKTAMDYALESENPASLKLIESINIWKACCDPDSGYTFWQNTTTGETQWTAPIQKQQTFDELMTWVEDSKQASSTSKLDDLQIELEAKKIELQELSKSIANQAEDKIVELQKAILTKENEVKLQADILAQSRIEEIQREQDAKLQIALKRIDQQQTDQQNRLQQLALENSQLKSEVTKEQNDRKELHNKLEEMKGKIRVYCRVRPVSKSETNNSISVYRESSTKVSIEKHIEGVTRKTCFKGFEFDSVFAMGDS